MYQQKITHLRGAAVVDDYQKFCAIHSPPLDWLFNALEQRNLEVHCLTSILR